MKYHQIDRTLFIKNRAKFIAQMKPNSVTVFNSNDIYPISADSTLPFAQHRDIFYLSGVDQEESVLLLFPDAPYEHQREMLFLKETSEHIAIWEGEKLTKERAYEVSGIKTVYWLQDFNKILNEMMTYCEIIYINTNEHYRAAVETETREDRRQLLALRLRRLRLHPPRHALRQSPYAEGRRILRHHGLCAVLERHRQARRE